MPGTGEFDGAGAEPGVEIYRIEDFKPVPWPKEKYGQFHEGDSYIVLLTKQNGSGLAWDLFFWLGAETSQDEQGTAAYKTVELDEQLGGGPIQYREVQDHESAAFLALFKSGIEYLPGGVASGFVEVDHDAYNTRLLHVKGRRRVRIKQVELAATSLNHGDVFVLDAGKSIFQWNGKEASRREKSKGFELARRLRDEVAISGAGSSKNLVVIDDGNEANTPEADVEAFWAELGGRGEIKPAADDDEAHEAAAAKEVQLFKVSNASGEISITLVGRAPLSREQLDSDDCFILDCGSEIFVWVGKGANPEERSHAVINAQKFLEDENRPAWTPITRVNQRGETPLFKEKFPDWQESVQKELVDFQRTNGSNIAQVEQTEVDIASLHQRREAQKADDTPVEGTVTVWRVEDFQQAEVNEALHGQFYAGDSYLVLLESDKEQLIYYWQGKDSSQDERGASALLAKQMDEERFAGNAIQIRVCQGKEPQHFLKLFRGRMIVHEGGRASGFKNVNDTDSYDVDGVSLFHVRGTNAIDTNAVQVAEVAGSLNSSDAFVLETPETQFVWFGKGCTEDERECAKAIAQLLQGSRAVVEIEEGEETDDFWTPLGGQGEYANYPHLANIPMDPRLFEMSNAGGNFTVEEVFNFDQTDLDNDDIMLLDTYSEVFVWVGQNALKEELEKGMETAVKYVDHAEDGRDKQCPILRVMAGFEPRVFTAHFQGWDPELVQVDAEYAAFVSEMQGGAAAAGGAEGSSDAALVADVRAEAGEYNETHTLAELQARPPPRRCDVTKLESYLSDEEFNTVFGMDKDAFYAQPKWKQKNARQKNGLF